VTERKPPRETWESFAERKIREAQEEGVFSGLPGFGRPIPGIDRPLDENWWVREKLRREQLSVVPPILEARLEVEKTLEAIRSMGSERAIRKRLKALNDHIREAHFSHVAGPSSGVPPIDIELVIREWKQHRRSPAASEGSPSQDASGTGA